MVGLKNGEAVVGIGLNADCCEPEIEHFRTVVGQVIFS